MAPASHLRNRSGSPRDRRGWPAGDLRRSANGRPNERQSAALLLCLLALGIVLGILHNKWRAGGRPDPVLGGVRLLTHPFQSGGSVVESGLFEGWNALFRGRELERENARLSAEVADLKTRNEALRLQAAEVDRLRAAVGLVRQQPKPPLAASVIALLPSPHFDTITVNRGARDGVRAQTIARTPDGLVGQVTDTSALSSEIMLLSDTNSGVSGTVWRAGKSLGVVGIVDGMGRGKPLEMRDLKRDDDIRPGDTVVSSGLGGVFPPDVPIGTIVSVNAENALFLKSALVAPAAGMPGDLREVYLLRP